MALTFSLPNFGLGGGPLGGTGGGFSVESEEIAWATVQHCLAQGVTLLDTAPLYGSGVSERRIGKVLAGVPRTNYQISTKIGVVVHADGKAERTYRRDAVKRSIEDSLQRLGIDYIEEPIHEFFPLCAEKQISVLLGGVFNSGILATGATPSALYQYRPAPPAVMEKTRRIEAVCARHGVSLKAAALQFPLAHPVVRSLVVGMASPAEVDQNLAALREPIPAAFWGELRKEELIEQGAPTPA